MQGLAIPWFKEVILSEAKNLTNKKRKAKHFVYFKFASGLKWRTVKHLSLRSLWIHFLTTRTDFLKKLQKYRLNQKIATVYLHKLRNNEIFKLFQAAWIQAALM